MLFNKKEIDEFVKLYDQCKEDIFKKRLVDRDKAIKLILQLYEDNNSPSKEDILSILLSLPLIEV